MSKDIAGSALDLVRSSVAPRVFKTGPPNYYTQTSFNKRIDVSGTFQVSDRANLADGGITQSTAEKVPTASGLLVWQPNRGASSLYRFGIVPSNAQVTKGTRNFALPSHFGTNQVTLKFASATAVPYNASVSSDVPKIAPELGTAFSSTRVFSGDIRIICDTVPIGNTALNGYLSAGAFSDTRDITQSDGIGGSSSCFDPNDLVQTSVTTKDGLKEVSAMKGIVSLVGSDIQPFYSPPNTDETDFQHAGWAKYTVNDVNDSVAILTGTGGLQQVLSQIWVSPWGVTLTETGATVPIVNVPRVEAINLTGVLDIEAHYKLGKNNAVTAIGCVQSYHFGATHVFATCSSDGWKCNYHCGHESMVVHVGCGEVESAAWPADPLRVKFSVHPRMFQSGIQTTDGGIYLGTYLNVIASNFSRVDSTAAGVGRCGSVDLYLSARSIYNPGELGPARVIRWDAISDGQQIKLDGVFNAQCIPEGSVAPFVQNMAMYSDTAGNLNSMTLLAELYNGDTPFRRNWTGEAYDEFMRTVFPKISADLIKQWKQPKLLTIAKAGGLFDAVAAGMMGPVVGPVVTSLMHSSGQFGAKSNAAGQFGSAGQFMMKAAGSRKRGKSKTRKGKGRKTRSKAGSVLSAARSFRSAASSTRSSRKPRAKKARRRSRSKSSKSVASASGSHTSRSSRRSSRSGRSRASSASSRRSSKSGRSSVKSGGSYKSSGSHRSRKSRKSRLTRSSLTRLSRKR